MRRTLAVLAAVILWPMLTAGSCASTSTPPLPKVVEVPVSVPCAADPGPQPAYGDSDPELAKLDIFEGVKRLVAGRDLRDAFIGEALASNKGCRK